MEIFRVDFKKLDSVGNDARRIADKIGRRIDDYEKIVSDTNRISGSHRNNVSTCQQKIARKISSLEEKQNALRAFADKAEYYADKARDVDKRVANRIETSSETFEKQNNIKIGFFDRLVAGIEQWIRNYFGRYGRMGRDIYARLTEWGRNIKNDIRRWYCDEGGKYIVNAIWDIAMLALSVLNPASTILGVFFLGFSVFKGVSDICYDIIAYDTYRKTGNKALADREDEKGGRDVVVGAAEDLGGENFAKFMNIVYTGVEWGNLAYGTVKFAKNVHKKWDVIVKKGSDGKNVTGFKQNLSSFHEGLKKTNNYDELKKLTLVNPTDKKALSAISRIEKITDNPVSRFKGLLIYEGFQNGKGLWKTIKIPGKVHDNINDTIDMDRLITDRMTFRNNVIPSANGSYSGGGGGMGGRGLSAIKPTYSGGGGMGGRGKTTTRTTGYRGITIPAHSYMLRASSLNGQPAVLVR